MGALCRLPKDVLLVVIRFLDQADSAQMRCVNRIFCDIGTRSARATGEHPYVATMRQLVDPNFCVRAHRPRAIRVKSSVCQRNWLHSMTHKRFSSRVEALEIHRTLVDLPWCALPEQKVNDASESGDFGASVIVRMLGFGENEEEKKARVCAREFRLIERRRLNPQICLLPLRALAATLRNLTVRGYHWQWAHTLRELTRLETLDATHLNTQDMATLPASLKILVLETSSDDLRSLKRLPALRHLVFERKHRRSATVLKLMLQIQSLRLLVCSGADVPLEVAEFRASCLQALELQRTSEVPRLLANLSAIGSSLVHLILHRVHTRDDAVFRQILARLPRLRTLGLHASIYGCPVEDGGQDAALLNVDARDLPLLALEIIIRGQRRYNWPAGLRKLQYMRVQSSDACSKLSHDPSFKESPCAKMDIPRMQLCFHALELRVLDLYDMADYRIEWTALSVFKQLSVLRLNHTALLDDVGCFPLLLGDRRRGLPRLTELAFQRGSLRLPHLLVLAGLAPFSWCFAVASSTPCGAPDEISYARCCALLEDLKKCPRRRVRSGLDGSGMLLGTLVCCMCTPADKPLVDYARGEDACWMLHNERMTGSRAHDARGSSEDAALRDLVATACSPPLTLGVNGYTRETQLSRIASMSRHFSEEAQLHYVSLQSKTC